MNTVFLHVFVIHMYVFFGEMSVYLGVYLPKETKDLYIENYKTLMKEIRGHKQMEKYTVFMDWKNQYGENEYTTQNNL